LKLERLIIFSLLSCVLFSSLGLMLSPQMAVVHRLGFASLLTLAFCYQFFRLRWNRWIFNILAIFILTLSLAYGIWFAEYPIIAAIYFIGYIIQVRMFELETPRDFKLALLLSLFQISAASLMFVSVIYFFFLFGWLVSALFSMSLITIYSRAPVKKPLPAPGRLLGLLASSGVFSIVLGTVIFFFLPRIGFSFVNVPVQPNRGWSGFSNSIKVGDVNEVLESRNPVMRVSLIDHPARISGIKWRMRAMEFYESGVWQDQMGVQDVYPISYNQPVTMDLKPPKGEKITQEIFLEPGIGPDLPAAHSVFAFLLPYRYRIALTCANNHFCSFPMASYERKHYLAYSSLPAYSGEEINASLNTVDNLLDAKSDKFLGYFLQLPSGSDQVCKLADQVMGNKRTPLEKINALQNFFESKYKYSNSGLPTGENAVNDFLFKSKKGNCEYFATAGALMLRCQKIPSRIAAGFISGEWNEFEKYYLVRENDAHAWVEIYLPGKGFYEFDPTPVSGRDRVTSSSLWWRIADPIVFRWNRWIVEYSIQDQLRGYRRIGAETNRARYSLGFRAPEIRSWLKNRPLAGVGIILLLAGAVFLGFYLKDFASPRRRALKQLGRDERLAAGIYLEMFDILKRKGVEHKDSDTGIEAAEKIKSAPAAQKIVRRITNFYYQVRYGKHKSGDKSLEQAKSDLEDLKKPRTWPG
jgi:protein-glutamine gamma-glutamyltransferase